ncbi:hypothetical protein GCM10008094_29980 [Aidingimonas halophila]|nr:hypothetical protein GCM10008094_29980 [Aidingimonas halophila]
MTRLQYGQSSRLVPDEGSVDPIQAGSGHQSNEQFHGHFPQGGGPHLREVMHVTILLYFNAVLLSGMSQPL